MDVDVAVDGEQQHAFLNCGRLDNGGVLKFA